MKSPFLHLIIWILIVVGALAAQGVWYSEVSHKSAEVAQLQNQIDTKTETASRIASARITLSEIAGDEAIVQGYFVPETGVVPFIDDLETRARAQNATMKVLSVSVGGTSKQPTLGLSIALDGSFDAVMRTVGAIEYAPYDLVITKLSTGKTEKNIWHATLELVVGSVPAATASSTKPTLPKTTHGGSFIHYAHL
jgi:hypothetical protein